MITLSNLTIRFGATPLFENVNLKFTQNNCYGLIGANGAGKSTLLKIISGELEATSGDVNIEKGKRIAVLKQNHFAYEENTVLETVMMGHTRLWQITKERDALYSKEDFNDEDGLKVADLENEFAELDGWQAESAAASLLSELNIDDSLHYSLMKELTGSQKVRVLLAQVLFLTPDILILDEPTNHLDAKTISWLEEFLINFPNTVITVSHDRNFLDNVCTHIADIDYHNIKLYPGNYSFWQGASRLIQSQKEEQNKKTEEKMEQLKSFIARFSANASKAKQATSRKNMLDKLSLEEILPSSRKYPRILFTYTKMPGRDMFMADKLSFSSESDTSLKNFTIEVHRGEKIAFLSQIPQLTTTFFNTITGKSQPDSGSFNWGPTATVSSFAQDHEEYFQTDLNLIDWLRQFSDDETIGYIRGFLGRMLFSGEDSEKCARVLSGGEKVRCMLSKMMVEKSNILIFDEPTNHLDLEAITALNDSLIDYTGTILFASQDHRFVQTVANRIIEITPNGFLSSYDTYEEYLKDPSIQKRRQKLYEGVSVKN